MTRTLASLLTLALSAPLAAHEGMALDGAAHAFLHRFGTENVIALGGLVLLGIGAALLRRYWRARAAAGHAARHGDAG